MEILDFALDFAKLRIAVFREFPYLYDGDLSYELEYIKTYANCANAMVFAVYDGDQMVGATTCIPLRDETENVQLPFVQAGFSVENIFYFGESLLLKPYRGLGYGHRFFDAREQYAATFSGIDCCVFCAVDRPENHLLKPENYRSNELFWTKRNYIKQPEMKCEMSWKDLNESSESSKKLTFWLKKIKP